MSKQGQNKEGKTVLYLEKFLRSFRQTGESIPPKTIKSLLYQLCKGVAFCHGHGVLHRDLKPHNLLMDRKTSMLKIAIWGLQEASLCLSRSTLMRWETTAKLSNFFYVNSNAKLRMMNTILSCSRY
nr:cell division control protein 2 homolog D [Ipomoea batatas]